MVPPISARMTILALLQLAKASVRGALELLPSSFIFWNTGDSFKRSRIQTEMASSTTDTRNGMRQPQAAKSASPSADPHAPALRRSQCRHVPPAAPPPPRGSTTRRHSKNQIARVHNNLRLS